MSTFKVEVVEIENIEPIDGADRIELAVVGEYRSIIQKGKYSKGDTIVYIPESAVVPQNILEEMNLVGKLNGSAKNRVKAQKFKGVLSEGLVYPNKNNDLVGTDLQEQLGIVKWSPTIPESMRGQMCRPRGDSGIAFKYDIENWKKYSNMFTDGEQIFLTEKTHGTLGCFVCRKVEGEYENLVSSKGLLQRDICIKEDDVVVYWKVARKFDIHNKIIEAFKDQLESGTTVYVFGEVFGNGIQDLDYGQSSGEPNFLCFDILLSEGRNKRFLNLDELQDKLSQMSLKQVPVLHVGPYSRDVVLEHTNGNETISGRQKHIREGVVIKPIVERSNKFGRVVLKSVSGAYLTRKGNVTEYE